MPIDARFPVEDYQRLLDATERGEFRRGRKLAAASLKSNKAAGVGGKFDIRYIIV